MLNVRELCHGGGGHTAHEMGDDDDVVIVVGQFICSCLVSCGATDRLTNFLPIWSIYLW